MTHNVTIAKKLWQHDTLFGVPFLRCRKAAIYIVAIARLWSHIHFKCQCQYQWYRNNCSHLVLWKSTNYTVLAEIIDGRSLCKKYHILSINVQCVHQYMDLITLIIIIPHICTYTVCTVGWRDFWRKKSGTRQVVRNCFRGHNTKISHFNVAF